MQQRDEPWRGRWLKRRWSFLAWALFLPLFAALFMIDIGFLGANLFKFFEGGWLPVAVACFALVLMLAWISGRDRLLAAHAADTVLVTVDAQVPGSFFDDEALAAGIVRKRGSGRVRRNSKIDDDQLKALVADGFGLNAIAEHFSCTKQAVWAAKQRLGI